ncbi:MAG: hypothetical protein MUF10_10735 [Thermoanaerobaculaceae bacterium]|jgi:hypothetical protein|nr:hypothetical protein [Thermoanaerobaculaceae bacterium]
MAERHFLTTEASEFLAREYGVRIAPTTIETKRCRGTLEFPAVKIAGKVYYRESALRAFVEGADGQPCRPAA